jgi:alpha,alpha-trehalase
MRSVPLTSIDLRFSSYFISIGLLIDDYLDLAQGIVEHFVFEINHYGKILK